MKNISIILLLLVTLVGCSKDDDIQFTISQYKVSFEVQGGEQIVSITTDADWSCKYSADWLLVREQQNTIRIIAEKNPNEESRTALIHVLCNGNIHSIITVKQEGVLLNVDETNFEFPSVGETKSLSLQANSSDYTIDCTEDWIKAEKADGGIIVSVQRNFEMSDRKGTINLIQGAVVRSLAITQKACPWYESFKMVDIEGGTFFMGAQKDNETSANYDADAYQIEAPVHKVTVANYSIGVFEVTQEQWTAAMGNNPSFHQGVKLPVENVSWEQVQEFIKLLNEKSGLTYRLPTEAEWEYAARGGKMSEDNKYSGFSVLGACGWYYSNSESTTHEVGTKYPNELGIYDMSGNVREWCSDWFDYYTSTSVIDPKGPSSGSLKVNRGGSWTTPAVNCRNSYRHTDLPSEVSKDLGFRLILAY